MSNYTGAVPDTRPTSNWHTRAACLGKWAAMHPDNDEEKIAYAKTICGGCPVARECFWDAIATNDMEHGIRAGLQPNERRAVAKEIARRRVVAQAQPAAEQTAAPVTVLKAHRRSYTTLQALFNANTKRVIHGHLAWTGPAKPSFQGRSYNPKQVAFIVDRGREPEGRVLNDCGISSCVLPAHVADDAERMRCGTRAGYQRHRKRGEDACQSCRQANTDADNRLRRSGTSKAAA